MTDDDLIEPDDADGELEADSSDDFPISEGVMTKEAERRRLQAEVEAFLAGGGKINQIPPNVVADPPKKPESNYGGQPI